MCAKTLATNSPSTIVFPLVFVSWGEAGVGLMESIEQSGSPGDGNTFGTGDGAPLCAEAGSFDDGMASCTHTIEDTGRSQWIKLDLSP